MGSGTKMLRNFFRNKSLRCGIRTSTITGICTNLQPHHRGYHSYPKDGEVPKISQNKATGEKMLQIKDPATFTLPNKFKFENVFPGTPISKGLSSLSAPQTVSTVLPNGLTIASQESPGLMSSFAFIVRAGSSYEMQTEGAANSGGVTHMLELNAFRSTYRRSHMQLIEEVEKLGGMVQCIGTREGILYCVDGMRSHAEEALDILADTVLAPLFPENELEESRQIAQFQQEDLPAEIASRDLLQMAAYKGHPLSNYHFCPVHRLPLIDSNALNTFRAKHFFGSNCVLSGAGIDHETLVKIATKKFGSALPSGTRESQGIVRPSSVYTGGMLTEQRELKESFVKVAIGYEVGGWHDDLLIPICVFQTLLGGGSSFSAGGPGKGMFSRLYTQVLNQYSWVESVEAFVSIHEERGIFGIDGASPANNVTDLMRVIIDQLSRPAYEYLNPADLDRAKNMLKSNMMMQLESRLVLCEDIGRQFSTFGKREESSLICEKIDNVTAKDIMEVAQRMLASPPSIGVAGHDLSGVPEYEVVADFSRRYRAQLAENYAQALAAAQVAKAGPR